MTENLSMLNNYEDKGDKSFVQGFRYFFNPDPESMSSDEIRDLNSRALPKRIKNKFLKTTWHEMSSTTFIIPVSDGGTVTAYFLINQKQKEEKGVMPLTIFCHGGGWLHGNMDFYSTWLKYFSYTMGTAVLLIDYRLAPTYKFPTAVEDCYDAILWAIEGAKYWKIDPDKIYLAGDGFGATLAATATILLRDRKGPTLSGQILLYPMTDCRLRTESMENFKETPVLSQKALSWFIKNYSRELKDSLSPMMSPSLAPDLSRLPDALIIGAEIDPLRDDAILYGQALSSAGTKAKVLIAENAMHGFLPFKNANGREDAESAIWQFMAGRKVENIEFLSKKEYKTFRKSHEI